MSRRIRRRRVCVAGESSPRVTSSPTRAPRFAISAVHELGDRRTRPRSRPRRRSSPRSLQLCRNRRPAWRMRLPPRTCAQSRPCATPRRFAPPGGSAVSTRAAVLLVAIFAALSFGPATAAWRARTPPSSTIPSLTHALADPLLAPLARWDSVWYLAHRGLGLRGQRAAGRLLPALPAAGAGRRRRRSAAPRRRCCSRRTRSRWRPSSPRCSCSTGSPSSSWGGGSRGPRCSCSRCSRRPCTSARPTRRASSCCWRWARSTPPAAGAGPGRARARRCASATRSAGLLLLIPLALLWWSSRPRRPRDAAWLALAPLGIAAYAAWLGLVEGDALRFLDVQEAWSRELTVPLAGRLGRPRRGRGRRRASWRRARARRSTSRWRRATRSGSRRST